MMLVLEELQILMLNVRDANMNEWTCFEIYTCSTSAVHEVTRSHPTHHKHQSESNAKDTARHLVLLVLNRPPQG